MYLFKDKRFKNNKVKIKFREKKIIAVLSLKLFQFSYLGIVRK
jgi:hypothetical protein